MKLKWTDNRDRNHPELIQAELQIAMNFSFKCTEFHKYVKQNKELLEQAKCQGKYD